MAIKTFSKDTIDRLVSTANSGDLNTAVAVLNQSGLNEEQKAKITSILREPRSDMQVRIDAVFEENSVSTASSSQATPLEQACVSFADVSTSPFGNAYPCKFEFGGKHYQNATSCFLAQQYTDQPKLMEYFTTINPEDAAVLAARNPMTRERKISWENPDAQHVNKGDVLMHVQRAKFGQNPDLRKQLLETGAAYLVCQDHGLYLSDNMDGSGKNTLGTSLMCLRGEYGCTGQVAPPAAYYSAKQNLLATSRFIGSGLYQDIMELLFNGYLSQSDFKSLTAAACVNKHWNSCSSEFWARCDLKQLCPELTILDAEKQGIECDDEPKINKLALMKWVKEISPHVEGNAGVTLLTMTKGSTLNQLVETAMEEGLVVDVRWVSIIDQLGDVPVKQTYGILITNNVFKNSRALGYTLQSKLVDEHGCNMPTVQEYVSLCVFTNKVFNKSLYGPKPLTLGRSSTHVGTLPLIVGGSLDRIVVDSGRYSNGSRGAGGQRKF